MTEIQALTSESAAAIRLLHTHAFSPPVLPIYAGLDDSIDRLQRIGSISRLSANAHMTMGPLPDGSAPEAVDQLFDMYRVQSDGRTRNAWARAIEEASLGFAQHLHVALQSACDVLMTSGGTARDEDTTEVKRRAISRREAFYAAKITDIMRDHAHAVLDVVHRATTTKTPVTKTDVVRWAKEAMYKHDPLSRDFSNEDGLELVERIRQQGDPPLREAKSRACAHAVASRLADEPVR